MTADKNKMPSLFEAPKLEIADWQRLRKEALECRRCPLRSGCRQVIFGAGCKDSPLMLIGEGPGAQEDIEGRPFVGRAGQLLDKILRAINLTRQEVYVSNIVKCRPPSNRKPTPEEMAICLGWLEKEINIVKPAIIVLLGATALQSLIDPGGKITKVRGKWIERKGIKYMPTFHPAALLRDPHKKIPVWEDFQNVEKALKNL